MQTIGLKMAKPSQRDIEAAEELLQVLQLIDARWGGPWAIPDVGDNLNQLLSDGEIEFDADNRTHLETLHNHLARLLRTAPGFHGRVISGMCHVIMYEKNQILDPDSDCIELHPRFAQLAAAPASGHSENPLALVVPEGWRLVPVKPTIEMVEAGYEEGIGIPDRSAHARVIEQYDAMLAAAPATPAAQGAVPDGYALVPFHPTPEMVRAAEEAYMPFGDMDIALRMAILAAAPAQPAAQDQVDQQEDLHVWRATTRLGYTCHFGEASAARAWAGERGKVERIDLKPAPELSVVGTAQSGGVRVPRELLGRALKADASIGASSISLVDGWKAMAELRALLAAAATAQPAAQGKCQACNGVGIVGHSDLCPECNGETQAASPAQPAEVEGVEAVAYRLLDAEASAERGHDVFVFFDDSEFKASAEAERVKRTLEPLVLQSDHLAALSAVAAERDSLESTLIQTTTRHFAQQWKDRADDKKLDECLSEGIAMLEAERDALRAELDALKVQTEQQPVAWGAFHFGGSRSGKLYTHCETEQQIESYIADAHRSNDSITLRKGPLYAAPIAQTAPAPLAVSLSDDDRSALHQLAFELGGTEGGEYLLDAEVLDELIDAALAASTGQEVKP